MTRVLISEPGRRVVVNDPFGRVTRTGTVVSAAASGPDVFVRITEENGRRVVPFVTRVHHEWLEVAP